jgi:GNAT superfamily N-acetyltransferase
MNKIASIADWDALKNFYQKVYRNDHPLCNENFWNWQYGDEQYGQAFIALNDEGIVIGHVGASFGGDHAWIINVYLEPECRGKGILGELYGMARAFYPLAATSANKPGLGLYRNMNWYRYSDLERFVITNPAVEQTTEEMIKPLQTKYEYVRPAGHYFEQPGTVSHLFGDGSTGVVQSINGGIRAVDIKDAVTVAAEAWNLGFKWIDFITSWNDPLCRTLENTGWQPDTASIIPWRLSPVVASSRAWVTYLSEEIMPKGFLVHRSYSDHGRVGSL